MARTNGLECYGVFVRVILIIINVFYLLFGLLLSGIGVLLLVDNLAIRSLSGSDVLVGAIVILVAGAITILTAIMGIIGAAGAVWPLLIVYSVFILILLGFQLAVGLFAFIHKEQFADKFTKQLIVYVQNYTEDVSSSHYSADANSFIDSMQQLFKCCGLTGPADWLVLNPAYVLSNHRPPHSCDCISTNANTSDKCLQLDLSYLTQSHSVLSVWKKGCNQTATEFFVKYVNYFGGGAIFIVMVQIIVLLLAIVLTGIIIIVKRAQRRHQRMTQIQNTAYTPLEEFPSDYPTSTVNNDYTNDFDHYTPAKQTFNDTVQM